MNYKKEFAKGGVINELNREHTYLLIELPYSEIVVLVKNEDIELIRRLDDSHFIIKSRNEETLLKYVRTDNAVIANDEWKLSEKIRYSLKDIKESKHLSIVGLSVKELLHYLDNENIVGYKLLDNYSDAVTLQVFNLNVVDILKTHPDVTFIDFASPVVMEETVLSDHDLSINRVNKAHNDYPTNNGQGFTVSIKEDLFDNSDLDLLGRSIVSGIESSNVSAHASDMATIIGGAGNSFISGKGVAYGVTFTSSSFENILPDDDAIFNNLGITVQNHSYGTVLPDNRYSAEAKQYDDNTNKHPELLHVFSSGNTGLTTATNGTYKGLEGFANLSGSFKMAKNTLLVSAIDELGIVDERNSAGPAYDGRLKPELVAYGKSGTSESAAMVSGTAMLLQQLYKNKESVLPSSSLIKATMIAGSDDIGIEGVDFVTGYGNLNASKAMDIVNSAQYFSGEIVNGQQVTFNINVPTNVNELKIAMAWIDPAANTADNLALINDIDMKVVNVATNEEWLPWVLDHTASVGALTAPAVRKEDHLNNVEYITIDFPSSGLYEITVSSTSLLTSSQKFDIAYDWNFVDQFVWTYPTANDVINTNETTVLRWDTTTDQLSEIEIKIDNGNWVSILKDVDLTTNYVNWMSFTDLSKAKLRVNINGNLIESDEFLIAPLIEHTIGFNCEDKFMLQWNEIEGVDSYNIYKPGNKYLELITNTTDTVLVLDKANYEQLNYTVSPVLLLSEGNKSLAYNYENQGVNCYFRNYLVNNVNNEYVNVELNVSSTYDVKHLIIEKSTDSLSFMEATVIVPESNKLSYSFQDYNPYIDFSFYRAKIVLNDDTEISLDAVEVFFPKNETMMIFPNPVKQMDYFTILAKGDSGILQMIDLRGNIIQQWLVESNVVDYDLPNVQKGMYIMVLKRGNTIFNRDRLVVY